MVRLPGFEPKPLTDVRVAAYAGVETVVSATAAASAATMGRIQRTMRGMAVPFLSLLSCLGITTLGVSFDAPLCPDPTQSRQAYAGLVTSVVGMRIVRAGVVDYEEALAEQRRIHAEVADGTAPDTVLLLEHPSVYTAGKRTEPADRPFDGTPVVDV